MIKPLLFNILIASVFGVTTANAIQPTKCVLDNNSISEMLANQQAANQATGTDNNSGYLQTIDNGPFNGMSVSAMRPSENDDCIHTYLKLIDNDGKNIELVISYPASKISPNDAVTYVDIGEWKVIGDTTEVTVSTGSAFIFNPSDTGQKRFVLQQNVEQ